MKYINLVFALYPYILWFKATERETKRKNIIN